LNSGLGAKLTPAEKLTVPMTQTRQKLSMKSTAGPQLRPGGRTIVAVISWLAQKSREKRQGRDEAAMAALAIEETTRGYSAKIDFL
jgi:hypothetical protein